MLERLGQQHVLGLDVAVHQPEAVEVRERRGDLRKDGGGGALAVRLERAEAPQQLAAGQRLHRGDAHAGARLEHVEDAHDVGVRDDAQELCLGREDRALRRREVAAAEEDGLERDGAARVEALGEPDLGKAALFVLSVIVGVGT